MLSVAVVAGIAMMSKVRTAVAGNLLSALAMLAGVVATLLFAGILTAWTLYPALAVGALIGSLMASRAKMIQMPQLVALFNGLGGGASALVGVMIYMGMGLQQTTEYPVFTSFTAVFAIVVGMLTLMGSLVAAGKLHRLLNQRPVAYRGHNLYMLLVTLLIIASLVCSILLPSCLWVVIAALLASACFGWLFAIRVGGADMPVTISLLNSLSGVAGAIAGMATGDIFLVAVGGIVGASGLLLTQIMCRAMNRSLVNILVGTKRHAPIPKTEKLGKIVLPDEITEWEQLLEQLSDMEIQQLLNAIESLTTEIAALRKDIATLKGQAATGQVATEPATSMPEEKTAGSVLHNAKDVIIVPGYGMALAQAQHLVKQLADRLIANGAQVRFAIHPVAGRMPGHMNVLLAEADIPYEQLYEMEAINDDFKKTDAVVVIGANDVLNPAARNAEGTPIYGMPVLNVDEAPEVIVCNYDLKPGYAGVENPLYTRKQGVYLCLGDAKDTLMQLISAI